MPETFGKQRRKDVKTRSSGRRGGQQLARVQRRGLEPVSSTGPPVATAGVEVGRLGNVRAGLAELAGSAGTASA